MALEGTSDFLADALRRLTETIGADRAWAEVQPLRSTTPDALPGAARELLRRHGIGTVVEIAAIKSTAPVPAHDAAETGEILAAAKNRARRNWQRGAVRPAWSPRTRGVLAEDVYTAAGYKRLPNGVNARVRAAMSRTVLLAYLVCCDAADHDGRLELPAAQLGDLVGCNRRNAQRALDALLSAGLLTIVHHGGPRTPNVYGLVPSKEFDEARAVAALERHRAEASGRLERALEAKASRTDVVQGVAHGRHNSRAEGLGVACAPQ